MNKNIWFPKKSHNGYYDKALGRVFYSKNEKRDFMNAHGLVEDGSMENDRKRVDRIVEELNDIRNKQGKKSLTKEEFLGTSRSERECRFR